MISQKKKEIKMAKGKYDKYFLKEPWGVIHPGTPPDAPVYIGIGQKAPVEGWDEPLTQVLRPIYRPFKMILEGHRHSVADFLQRWLAEYARPGLSPRGYERYESIARVHITPSPGFRDADLG